MRFVSLHSHSTYSYMDGFGLPATHVQRVAELGMSALALTEHGNVSSHVKLEKAATAAGIKPIFGLEAYTEPVGGPYKQKCHLTVLASTLDGYRNLNRIVTRSWQNFYRWPTVSGQILAQHHDGLIVLSGCADSLLNCTMLGGKMIDVNAANYRKGKELAARFRGMLGDRYYLECQIFPELARSRQINRLNEALSAELGIPLVATADVHYPYPEDSKMRVILHGAGRGAGSVAAQEATWEYDIPADYPTSDRAVIERLRATGLSRRAASESLANTAEIASRCNVTLPKAERLRYPLPEGHTAESLLWEWLREGWVYRRNHGNERMERNRPEYTARLKHEMSSIVDKDFCDYFLTLSDAVRWAKDNGIPVGPARGSAAASLVAYLLRITEIDPMEFPLMNFERFIAPDREDEPDVDLDFDDELRHLVRTHVAELYGEDRVGNVGTYTKYKGKNSLLDISRMYPEIPYEDVHAIKSVLVERSAGDSRQDFTLLDTIEMFPAAKEAYGRNEESLQYALKLQGNYRGMSVHAAGVVLTNSPIADTCAMYTRPRTLPDGTEETLTVVSVDKYDAAYLGLMKYDFLGLSTMGMVRIALEIAGLKLEDLYAVPTEDPEVLEAFRRNDVVGIFQFEGRATKIICGKVKPKTFMDLADINTLSRPGPLFSEATTDYIEVVQGIREPEHYHPVLDEILAPTRGQVIYQEQVLSALSLIGGLDVKRVHEIRRIISAKLGEAQFNTHFSGFAEGAKRLHGMPEETAMKIWSRLVTSAQYSFNVAHAVSYARVAQWCMWLKVHHPVAFYTAQLRKTEPDRWPRLIRDAEAHGIGVKGVDRSRSGLTWTPDVAGKRVHAGWSQLKGVGYKTAQRIVDHLAEHGEDAFTSWGDLTGVKGIGEKTLAKFGSAMTDDPFGIHRTELALGAVRASIKSGTIRAPLPTMRGEQVQDAVGGKRLVWMGIVKKKEFKDFIEDTRARTGKDVEQIRAEIDRPHLSKACVLQCYDDTDQDVYVRFSRFDYPKFAKVIDAIREDRDVLVIRAIRTKGFGASLYVKNLYVIDPEDDDDDDLAADA